MPDRRSSGRAGRSLAALAPEGAAKPVRGAAGPVLAGLLLALLASSPVPLGCGEDGVDLNPARPAAAAAAAAAADAEEAGEERQSLVAMARLEPASRVVDVAAPSSDIVREILVEEGDQVQESQVMVRLESYALLSAELEAARLARERAKLKPLMVEAQRARVRSIEAELRYAKEEVGSQKDLSAKGFSAGSEFRDAQLHATRANEQLNEANATLAQMKADADLELREASNRIAQAEARLERSLIRAPFAGQVLRVRVAVGERADTRPVISLGATDSMYAVAEVHANEIRLVEPGQQATFTSPALPGPIRGVIENVGQMIFGNGISGGDDPSAPRGLRVVEVRVRLEHDDLARRLTNLEGQLRIHLDTTAAPPPSIATGLPNPGTDRTASTSPNASPDSP